VKFTFIADALFATTVHVITALMCYVSLASYFILCLCNSWWDISPCSTGITVPLLAQPNKNHQNQHCGNCSPAGYELYHYFCLMCRPMW